MMQCTSSTTTTTTFLRQQFDRNISDVSKVPVVYRYLWVSKNQLEVSCLKIFLKAFFKSAIGFFSTKAQTSTSYSKCVKFISLIVDQCI